MAQPASFDVTTGVDLQEVDNAINQAQKEIAQRYDFKGSKASIEFKRAEGLLVLVADSDFQMTALFDVVQTKLIKRGVPVKNLDIGEIKQAGGRHGAAGREAQDGARRRDGEEGRRGDQGREAQEGAGGDPGRAGARERSRRATICRRRSRCCASKDFGVELKFGNYR